MGSASRSAAAGALLLLAASQDLLRAGPGAEAATAEPLAVLSSAGCPVLGVEPSGRPINHLFGFEGRCYLGYGDYGLNTGPTHVLSFDPKTGDFAQEFTCDEDAIVRYRVLGGQLASPGVDATESWDAGNVYLREGGKWAKHRALAGAVHVFDLADFGGAWYAAAASVVKDGPDAVSAGTVYRSDDRGTTWKPVYSTSGTKDRVRRIGHLASLDGKLYAFPYEFGAIAAGSLPPEARPAGAAAGMKVLCRFPDPLGTDDTAVHDGAGWKAVDLFSEKDLAGVIHAETFGSELVLHALFGKHVFAGSPSPVRRRLYRFDGKTLSPVEAPGGGDIVDLAICGDRLTLLLRAGALWKAASTTDWKRWEVRLLPPFAQPRSIWMQGGRLLVGSQDGNLYVEEALEGEAARRYAAAPAPRRVVAGGRFPEEGRSDWAAVESWTKPGNVARVDARVADGSSVEVRTENASGFSLLLPHPLLEPEKPFRLSIDGSEAFAGKAEGSELRLSRTAKGWEASWGSATRESWRPRVEPLFTLAKPSMHDPAALCSPLCGWVADAFRAAAAADIGLANNGGIRIRGLEGKVSALNLWSLHHKGGIVTFRATGAELTAMLRHNAGRPAGERCRVSGARTAFRKTAGRDAPELAQIGVDPERTYTVAVQDYLAKNAEALLGRKVEAVPAGITVFEALLRHAQSGSAPPADPDGRASLE